MVISTKVRSWYLVPKWLLFLNQWWEWYFSPLHTTRCYGVSNSEKSFQYVGEPDSSARAYKYFTQNRHSHVHIYRHTHAHAHTCTHIQAHTRTHTQTHTCTHIEAHTHTHTRTLTYTNYRCTCEGDAQPCVWPRPRGKAPPSAVSWYRTQHRHGQTAA